MSRAIIYTITLFLFTVSVFSQNINKFDANGKRHGMWEKKNTKGELLYKGEFNHGTPINEFKYFFSDNTVKATIKYENSSIAHSTTYYYNGKIKAKGDYVNKKRNGKWNFFSEEGVVISNENYINGVKEGVSKTFYPSGKLLEKINYKNDIKEGEWLQYFESGKIRKKAFYKN